MNIRQLSLLLLSVVAASSVFSQTMWCPKAGIQGFEDLASQAKRVLHTSTSDLQQVEVYVSVKDNRLYLHSNYKPEDADYPFKLATDQEQYDLEGWIKLLIDPDADQEYNPAFHAAYRDNMVLYIDPAVFSNSHYKNLDWGEAKNIKFASDRGVMDTEVLPYTNKRAVKVYDNTYMTLDREDACEIADQLSKIKTAIDKLTEEDTKEVSALTIYTNSTDEQIQAATKQPTFRDFFNMVTSSGLTLVNLTCEPGETIKDLVFDAYKEAAAAPEGEKLGQITIRFPSDPAPLQATASNNGVSSESGTSTADTPNSGSDNDSSSGTGLGKAWYFIIGIVVIVILRALLKQT